METLSKPLKGPHTAPIKPRKAGGLLGWDPDLVMVREGPLKSVGHKLTMSN